MATTNQDSKPENSPMTLGEQVAAVTAKVDMLVSEMRDFKNEMRDRDNQRAAEIIELRQRQDANQKEFTKELRSNFVQTMLGVGAIMAAIGGLIVAILK